MLEIERKFLIHPTTNLDELLLDAKAISIKQAYIFSHNKKNMRIRCVQPITPKGAPYAYITLKQKLNNTTRNEFEYPIPYQDASAIILSMNEYFLIEKVRYYVPYSFDTTLTWEIDVFRAHNTGLITAELELPSPDTPIHIPWWIAREITDEPQYTNASLAKKPFSLW